MKADTKQRMAPIDVSTLLTHEIAALLHGADQDGIAAAEELCRELDVLRRVTRQEDAVHPAWVQWELDRAKAVAAGVGTPSLLSAEQLTRVPAPTLQMEAVWSLFETAVHVPEETDRQTLLDLTETLAGLWGLHDRLQDGGDDEEHSASLEELRIELGKVRALLRLDETGEE